VISRSRLNKLSKTAKIPIEIPITGSRESSLMLKV
jgi:hypothetical protein